jgi:hypothetical protein
VRRVMLAAVGVGAALTVLALPAPETPGQPASDAAVLMFHRDLGRTGWTPDERALTPVSVRPGAFGKLWSVPVEGDIYAQPLVVPGVEVAGRVRTVVYVATERDRVYAFDAADGARVWGPVVLGTPVPLSSLPCGNIDPVGATSTPVADPSTGALYVAYLTTPDGGRVKTYRIAALDLATGAMKRGWPVAIAPPVTSGLRFDAGVQQQRGALLLVNRAVYVPFGGYWGDCGSYHGWVVGVPLGSPRRQQAFVTPTHRMGGIWATGGISADAGGRLYVATGNSDSRGPVDLGNSVVRLSTSPTLHFSGMTRDFFAPSNFVSLNDTDTDLGSMAPLVLPDQPELSTPRLLFIAGKQGVGYLLDRDNLGGVGSGNGIRGEGLYSACLFGTCQGGPPEVFSAAAYWDGGPSQRLIYVPGHGRQPSPCHGTGGVVAMRLGPAPGTRSPSLTLAWCSPSMRDPGAPWVSSAGREGGVVWVVDTGSEAALYALDARTGRELYVSRGSDAPGPTHRFITPVVAGGHVYVGAAHAVVAYGLRERGGAGASGSPGSAARR